MSSVIRKLLYHLFRNLLCFLFLWYSKRVKIGVTHDPDFRCRPRSGLRSGVAHDPDYRSHPRSGLCTGVAHDPDYSTSVAHDPDYRCHPRSGLQASPSTRAIYSSELGFFLLTPFFTCYLKQIGMKSLSDVEYVFITTGYRVGWVNYVIFATLNFPTPCSTLPILVCQNVIFYV